MDNHRIQIIETNQVAITGQITNPDCATMPLNGSDTQVDSGNGKGENGELIFRRHPSARGSTHILKLQVLSIAMELLSTSASITALLALATRVMKEVYALTRSANGVGQELDSIAAQVTQLVAILHGLKSPLSGVPIYLMLFDMH